MLIKVHGGTPTGDKHLCDACVHGRSRIEAGKARYFCGMYPDPKGPVTQCHGYVNRNESQLLQELDSAAWYLDKDENGRLCFTSPADRRAPRRRRVRRRVDAEFVESVPTPNPKVN